ncbi:MAG: hypothetical protein KBC96_11780 [Armatimonadetes bacterium]|nr:hypothetical protein [Armatimonadota bacterium]
MEASDPAVGCYGPISGLPYLGVNKAGDFGVGDGQHKKLKIVSKTSEVPMSACDVRKMEAILARVVARAFAADHPELFPHMARMNGDEADVK